MERSLVDETLSGNGAEILMIVLEDVEIAITIGSEDVEVFFPGKEFSGEDLHLGRAFAKGLELIRLFLRGVSVLSRRLVDGITYHVACKPDALDSVANQQHPGSNNVLDYRDTCLHV